MLVGRIADQLGNQMFTYASLKTIATDRGEEFYFIREHNDRINDSDQYYGDEIHTMFPRIRDEFLPELPPEIVHTYQEPPISKRKTNYQESALQVPENTLMLGHYISCRYFAHRLDEVRSWFAFPKDVERKVEEELAQMRHTCSERPLVAIHFRVGEDYMRQGFRIKDSYWTRAADYITQQLGEPPIFLIFYDRKEKVVQKFIDQYESIACRGSLLHDLCMMSKCDRLILSNSSFSIMSAVLNSVPEATIIRPSVYPVGQYMQPQDCFMDHWTVIEASQSLRSRANYWWMRGKGMLLKRIRKI